MKENSQQTKMTLDAAVEYAEEHLPDGWFVEIYVGPGYSWIRLESPDGEGTQVDTSKLSLAGSVVGAVHVAVEGDQS
jgi:hypothetical protein